MNSIPLELKYNELNYTIQFNKNNTLGILQDFLLTKFNLLIFNIEHSKIYMNQQFYIIGNQENPFDMKLVDFLEKYNVNNIDYVQVYDRRRDENGNVIQENEIIENYQRWLEIHENNYMNFFNQSLFQISNNSYNIQNQHMNDLHNNFLNQFRNIINQEMNIVNNQTQENNNEDNNVNNDEDNNRNNESSENNVNNESNENNESNQDRIIENDEDSLIEELNNLNNNFSQYNNNLNINEELNNIFNNSLNHTYNINHPNTINNSNTINNQNNSIINNSNNTVNYENRIINTILETFNNIPIYTHIPDSSFQQNQNEDVIVALTNEEFNQLEEIEFNTLKEECTCNICLETLQEESRIIRLSCGHLFNYDCIENWLKNHSNKCPNCRVEVAPGRPINL
jgi:hypothetical protein